MVIMHGLTEINKVIPLSIKKLMNYVSFIVSISVSSKNDEEAVGGS
jgi:hypothetical protein